MTTAQVVETSVTVNNNSPIQDYVHFDDETQPTVEIILLSEKTRTQNKRWAEFNDNLDFDDSSHEYPELSVPGN